MNYNNNAVIGHHNSASPSTSSQSSSASSSSPSSSKSVLSSSSSSSNAAAFKCSHEMFMKSEYCDDSGLTTIVSENNNDSRLPSPLLTNNNDNLSSTSAAAVGNNSVIRPNVKTPFLSGYLGTCNKRNRYLSGSFSVTGDTMEGIVQCLVFLKAFAVRYILLLWFKTCLILKIDQAGIIFWYFALFLIVTLYYFPNDNFVYSTFTAISRNRNGLAFNCTN